MFRVFCLLTTTVLICLATWAKTHGGQVTTESSTQSESSFKSVVDIPASPAIGCTTGGCTVLAPTQVYVPTQAQAVPSCAGVAVAAPVGCAGRVGLLESVRSRYTLRQRIADRRARVRAARHAGCGG